MVHEKDVSMTETQVCSTARIHFLQHSRDFIQHNTGTEFVTVQGAALRVNSRKKKYFNIPAEN